MQWLKKKFHENIVYISVLIVLFGGTALFSYIKHQSLSGKFERFCALSKFKRQPICLKLDEGSGQIFEIPCP